jgi:two-component system, chemotaxis family, chemotaxis protein CheY
VRFLVVDDDLFCRELLKAIFAPYGPSDLAMDGSEAISFFRRALEDDQPYDVIFLDVVMPGLSGLETLDCIRQIESNYNIHGPKRVKILVVTGFNDPKLSIRSFRKDCENYLAKPFTPKQVLDKVREISDDFLPLSAVK